MNRRSFLGTLFGIGGGLVLPYEPERVYSFARELRVPGVEEFEPGRWHRLNISWDGRTARGLINDEVVVEGSDAMGGVFFEYDALAPSGWRGRLGKATMDESGLFVERGNIVVDSIYSQVGQPSDRSHRLDYRAGWSPGEFEPPPLTGTTPRTMESIVRCSHPHTHTRLRLGWSAT